jgi:HTH-type transcriptional regulator / antitoxin HigA
MIKPIKNNVQYESALSRIYLLMQKDLKVNSPESDELEILSVLVKEYENFHFPMPKPKPLEAIKFRLEQKGMTEGEI